MSSRREAIHDLLQAPLADGNRVLILERGQSHAMFFDGVRSVHFHLRPEDRTPWDLFDEFERVEDVAPLMRRLMPAGDALIFSTALTERLWRLGEEENRYRSIELWRDTLLTLDGADLRDHTEGTAAEAIAIPPNGPRVRAVRRALGPMVELASRIACRPPNTTAAGASVRGWIEGEIGEWPLLRLEWGEESDSWDDPSDSDPTAAKPLMTALAGWGLERALKMHGDGGAPLWVVLDGLDELPPIPDLPQLKFLLGLHGVRVILAYASSARLEQVYAKGTRDLLAKP